MKIICSGMYLIKAVPMLLCVHKVGELFPANWKTTFAQIAVGGMIYLLTLLVTKDRMLWYLTGKARELIKQKKGAKG